MLFYWRINPTETALISNVASYDVALALSGCCCSWSVDVGVGSGGSKGGTNHLSLPGQVLPGDR